MLTQSRGVVLYTLKYNDDSLIVHILTETNGMVSFLVRISHSPRAAIRRNLFLPLALLNLEWNHKPGDQLNRLKSANIASPHISIPYDPLKAPMAIFLSEFVHHALRNEPASASLFEYVYRSVEWLDTAQKHFSNFHLVFLLRLARFLGFFPEMPKDIPEGYCFDLEKCTFTSHPPLHSNYLSPADASRLPKLLRMRYENMYLFRLNGMERNRFLTILNQFYSLHVPNFPELQSLPILRDIFA